MKMKRHNEYDVFGQSVFSYEYNKIKFEAEIEEEKEIEEIKDSLRGKQFQ